MRLILIFLTLIFSCFASYAQNGQTIQHEKGGFVNGFIREIFKVHPDIVQMKIQYINRSPLYLDLYKRDSLHNVRSKSEGGKVQHLDLKFEGDIEYMQQKYKTDVPFALNSILDSIEKLKFCEADYKTDITIDRDSIRYDFLQHCPTVGNTLFDARKYLIPGTGDSILHEIEKRYDSTFRDTLTNAGLFFQGTIERDGRLTDICVISTGNKIREHFILEQLQLSGNSWHPAIQSGRPVRSSIKLFVRLKNGKCRILTTEGRYVD